MPLPGEEFREWFEAAYSKAQPDFHTGAKSTIVLTL
jgi:hypothetical protein